MSWPGGGGLVILSPPHPEYIAVLPAPLVQGVYEVQLDTEANRMCAVWLTARTADGEPIAEVDTVILAHVIDVGSRTSSLLRLEVHVDLPVGTQLRMLMDNTHLPDIAGYDPYDPVISCSLWLASSYLTYRSPLPPPPPTGGIRYGGQKGSAFFGEPVIVVAGAGATAVLAPTEIITS